MATTSDERPVWALANGLPSAHLVRAALRSAGLIGAYGSRVRAVQSAYVLYPSDAMYPPNDLRLGERLLLDCGLLLEQEGYLHPTLEIEELLALDEEEAIAIVFERAVLAVPPSVLSFDVDGDVPAGTRALAEELIPDPERREALLLALGRKHDDASRSALGLRGEEFVVARARHELIELDCPDLASEVRRLSEFADDLGYDIVAPRIGGKRRLEVKTSGRTGEGLIRCFLSRNEIDWGLRDADWALVACRVLANDEIELVGWCRARALEPYLPIDGEGSRWTSAALEIPLTLFESGLPSAV